MYLLRQLRARSLRRLLVDQRDFYEKDWTPDAIREWQLDQFNAQWQVIRRSVPYFERLQQERDLPARFSSWQEFKERIPIMDRKVVQNDREALTSRTRGPDFWRTTGGSTAEPLQIPTWNSEREFATKDIWYGRSWFGVAPSDKLFLIWGHSHLLGSGFRGWLNGGKRRLTDAFLGYYRYSAYDLSERGLREAVETLLDFQPAYVVAYAVALDRFVRVNRDYQGAFHSLGLKVAIATGESFPRPDSAQLVAQVLGCPVVMEYGAVETGLIAHQRPNGQYLVFWRHNFLEGYESEHLSDAYEILVTTLYPRCFPLLRYKIGDLISENPNDQRFVQAFEAVTGRCNDYVILGNDGVVHSEAFSHVVKDFSSILGYQLVQTTDGDITLNYMAREPLGLAEMAEIKRRLNKINAGLARVSIERVESLEQTIAGKTRRICRDG